MYFKKVKQYSLQVNDPCSWEGYAQSLGLIAYFQQRQWSDDHPQWQVKYGPADIREVTFDRLSQTILVDKLEAVEGYIMEAGNIRQHHTPEDPT